MTSIKWDEVVTGSIPVFQSFIDRGVVPTLRTIHYALVSKNIIPNTKSAYKGLSSAFVKARQQGVIHWDWLADEGRNVNEGNFNCVDNYLNIHTFVYLTKSSYIYEPNHYTQVLLDNIIRNLKKSLFGDNYFYYPKWMNQKYYIEVWIEKNALRATFENYLGDYNIIIVPSRGFSSWTFLKEAYDRIRKNANGKTPLILYFGDFDPSGEDIERFLRESMNGYFGIDIKVIRIGVTKDQIEEYNLPTTPEDAEEIEKLHRDSRFAKWEHGDYRVELDALLAFVPNEFERIVKESVKEYFNEDIYEDTLNKEAEAKETISEKLKDELPQKIRDLLKELGLEEDE